MEETSDEVACWTSSDASSSISVVSVPLDVTGEGPTMSLGLMTCIDWVDIRLTELGRREAESVAGGGEELEGMISDGQAKLMDDMRHTRPGRGTEAPRCLVERTCLLG